MPTRAARVILPFICILALSACTSREQADAKLAKGCEAAVKAVLPESATIERIQDTKFSPAPDGPDMRHVTLNAISLDGWLEVDETYECTFEESFGLFNMSYSAAIIKIKAGEEVYGRSGGEILGEAEDFIKITDAVRKAMYE